MDKESRNAVIAGAMVIMAIAALIWGIGWNAQRGAVEETKRMQACVAADKDWTYRSGYRSGEHECISKP